MSKTYTIEQVKAVILVGGRDFGRCPLATRMNRALWPIIDKPALQYMIEAIFEQGIRRFVICCDEQGQEIQKSLNLPASVEVEYQSETLPRGTAGCLKDAVREGQDELLIVFQAMLIPAPNIHELMTQHNARDSEMTVFFYPKADGQSPGRAAQLYLCEKSIVSSIPETGYCDLKEGLIPQLVRAGKTISAGILDPAIQGFRNWQDYLAVVSGFISLYENEKTLREAGADQGAGIWIHQTACVAPTARIIGPVVIAEDACIEDHAVVIGPAVIGKRVRIGGGAYIDQSVIWEGAEIGSGCQIERSLVDSNKIIKADTASRGKLLAEEQGWSGGCTNWLYRQINRFSRGGIGSKKTLADYVAAPHGRTTLIAGGIALVCCMLAAYAIPTLRDLWKMWVSSDEYSSGMLVPVLAIIVLWMRRNRLMNSGFYPSVWMGTALLLFAQGVRFFGLYYMFGSLENISMILTLIALSLLVFGFRVIMQVWSVLLFLFLMLPLPRRVQNIAAEPLQEWATASAVFVLETLGFNVAREGNVINLNGTMVAVAEACNGLRMLTAFIVVSALVVLISERSRIVKLILLMSSIPIALLCNTLRLAATSIAFTMIASEQWEKAFHDYGGLAMMPVALFMAVGELWLLSKLFYEQRFVEPPVSDMVFRKSKDSL
ncbi:MAG: exosortase [Anaerohalosphaeraceae bacterium]